MCHSPIYEKHACKTNSSLEFPVVGFTLLENDQKRIFYVILWVYGLPEVWCRVLCGSQPIFCTWPSTFTWMLRCKANIAIKPSSVGFIFATNRAEMHFYVLLREFGGGLVPMWGGGRWVPWISIQTSEKKFQDFFAFIFKKLSDCQYCLQISSHGASAWDSRSLVH